MSVKKLVIPTTFTDLTLPKLDIDAVIAPAGALFLFDFAHPEATSFVTADLVNGFTRPNLVYDRWHALYGSSTDANSRLTLNRGAGAVAPHAVVEKTGKGGIHLGFCQEAYSATRNASIVFGSDFRAYVAANPTHSFYWSIWARVTRQAVASQWSGSWPAFSILGSGADLAIFYTRPTGLSGGNVAGVLPGTPRRIGYRADGGVGTQDLGTNLADTGPLMKNVGVSSVSGAVASGIALQAGSIGGIDLGAYPSSALYRTYLEDLTVSGRTYAQVDALDYAEYQKQVLTAGGRYYGDTFTAPSTLT